MMHSSITSKGQVTIPKKIREFLKARTSDKIIFTPVENGKVLITTKQIPGAVLFGMLKHRSPARHLYHWKKWILKYAKNGQSGSLVPKLEPGNEGWVKDAKPIKSQ